MNLLLIECTLILLLLLANGVFAMTEIAIVSSKRGLLKAMADSGNPGAARALALADEPNRFLSTVQIGITLVGIVAAAFGGANIANRLAVVMADVPVIGPFAPQVSFVLVIGVLTYFTLIIGELVPKSLAMRFPEKIACTMARPMEMLARFAGPAVSVLAYSTSALLRIVGVKETAENRMSREEFTVLVREGIISGSTDVSETRMMEGVFGFENLDVYDIMIPRPKIVWLDQDMPHEACWQAIVRSTQTHFPVFKGQRDYLVGVVSLKDCYAKLAAGKKVDFQEVMQPPLLVPEIQKASVLLETFRVTGNHVAFVVNEFGSVIGMVTLMDLMETIVGDVPSQEERLIHVIQQREDGSWLVDGLFEIEKLGNYLEGFIPSEGAGSEYQTLAGLFSQRLARVPLERDVLEESGWRFEILDMDGIRVDKVLATKCGDGL
ncbi:MAG: hemolysin family protein [Luteolibacter sp.]